MKAWEENSTWARDQRWRERKRGGLVKTTPLGHSSRRYQFQRLDEDDLRVFVNRGWRVRSSALHVLPR